MPSEIRLQQIWKDRDLHYTYGMNRYILILQVAHDNIQVIESSLYGIPAAYALPKTLPAFQLHKEFEMVSEPQVIDQDPAEPSA